MYGKCYHLWKDKNWILRKQNNNFRASSRAAERTRIDDWLNPSPSPPPSTVVGLPPPSSSRPPVGVWSPLE